MGNPFTPIYTTLDNVKVRLNSKVQFQKDPSDLQPGELPDVLLAQLIVDAETKVEQDFRSRYAIPFRSDNACTWESLPDHSRRAIRTAVDLKAVIEVMMTDFGRGTHVNAEGYKKTASDEYKAYVLVLLGYDPESSTDERHKRFRFAPPIDNLMLAKTNSKGDDGYKGMIINTDSSHHGAEQFALEQINDPSKNYARRGPLGGIIP